MRGSAISESAEETEEESLPAQPSDEISLQEEMELLRSRIPEEPTEGRKWIEGPRAGDIIRVRIVYPDGTKLQRNFLRSDDVGLLLDLVTLDIFDHQHMGELMTDFFAIVHRNVSTIRPVRQKIDIHTQNATGRPLQINQIVPAAIDRLFNQFLQQSLLPFNFRSGRPSRRGRQAMLFAAAPGA